MRIELIADLLVYHQAPTLDLGKLAFATPSPETDLPFPSKYTHLDRLMRCHEPDLTIHGPRSEYKTFLRDFWDTQTQTFENRGHGWIFWTWKAAVSTLVYQPDKTGSRDSGIHDYFQSYSPPNGPTRPD
jgi:hypothetical protein